MLPFPAKSWLLRALRSLRVLRGLRVRLALTYLVFFSVLLVLIGLLFRQQLSGILEQSTRDTLNQEWAAVKGYLRIEHGYVNWIYDREDPDEARIVDNLQEVYMLADTRKVYQKSETYEELGIETPDEIQAVLTGPQSEHWTIKRGAHGEPYLIRSGKIIDEQHHAYFLAIGRTMRNNQKIATEFTRNYFMVLPLLIFINGVLGWLMAGRALHPVNLLAQTASRISSSNLSTQIPMRGAKDELDHLIQSFNRMIERLSASFTQTRQFSTDVSHELRTPLTVIRGQLEVALLTANTVEQYREAIGDALQDVDRLAQTIRVLLQLSQAESGQVILQKTPLNFSAVVEDIVEQYQIPAEGAGVHLSAQLTSDCYLEGDRIQLERLLYNLLSNAVKYTREGGSVVVKLYPEGEHLVLVIQDTGVGIPPDHLPHIFDRFYRVPSKEGSPQKGLGLGLSFVAWIVKAHGGVIHVDSKLGEGTTFTVLLPQGVPDLSPVPAEKRYTGEELI